MSDGAIIGIVGGVLVGLVVRVSNMVCAWLARALRVTQPDPITDPLTMPDSHEATP